MLTSTSLSRVLAVASIIALTGCSVSSASPRARVTTLTPQIPDSIKASGLVLSRQEAGIYPRRDGIVSSLTVDVGDQVKQGQVIATLQADGSQQYLAADLNFKRKELEIVRERESKEESQAVLIAQLANTALETERKVQIQERDADMKQVDTQIDGVETEMEQNLELARNTMTDLVQAITRMLYTRNDALENYDRNSGYDYYRRNEIFYPRDAEASTFEGELRRFNSKLSSTTDRERMLDLVNEAISLGEDARRLSNNFSPSPELPVERIELIRADIGNVIDRLLKHMSDAKVSASRIQTLLAEKERVVAGKQRTAAATSSQRPFVARSAEIIEAEIERIKQQMGGGGSVTAPFSGVITKRNVNVGDSVDSNRPLVSIVDDSQKFVRFFVTQESFPYIDQGLLVTFAPTFSPGEKYAATVNRISQAIDQETGLIQVEAEIPDSAEGERILSRMSVVVHIPVTEEFPLMEIPKKALELSDRPNTVWTVKRSKASPKTVKVKFLQGDYAYIESGLTDDDEIIIESPVTLQPSVAVYTD
ncbi:MAG: efflux RND transporter periplasmic adaptor subunit [Candidatus Peregrinibacteria bacterium]|nr:efflux RND transporter periplasmic adaptor subunit [Candidatus Peregrinibacteria bacterium]